jgi:hypothetical protein
MKLERRETTQRSAWAGSRLRGNQVLRRGKPGRITDGAQRFSASRPAVAVFQKYFIDLFAWNNRNQLFV